MVPERRAAGKGVDLSDAQLSPIERSDPRVAGRVIRRIFAGKPDGAERAYREFLTTSTRYLSKAHPDHWAITLFHSAVRLNVGWVEFLVLDPETLRVLVLEDSAPPSTAFVGRRYRLAPDCRMVGVPLAGLTRVLPGLLDSHQKAFAKAANRRPGPNIRNAHSRGLTRLWKLPDPGNVKL